MQTNDKKQIFIIGRGKEFLIRGATDSLSLAGYMVYFSDVNVDSVYPVPPYIDLCIVFSDGSDVPKHVTMLNEACVSNNLPICIIGDKLGIEKIRQILPENNIKIVMKRPVGANDITENIGKFFKGDEFGNIGGVPGLTLISNDPGFSDGFKRHFSSRFKVHGADGIKTAHVAISLKDVVMVVADCQMLSDNDYSVYNELCSLPSFQKLPLVVITPDEDVVNLARAEIMRPVKVIYKTMTINKMIQALEDVVSMKSSSIGYHEPVTFSLKGSEPDKGTTDKAKSNNAESGLLGALESKFSTPLTWD